MRWFLFCSLAGVVWVLRTLFGPGTVEAASSALLGLGVIMIGGELTGDLAERVRLPRITGYLVLGMAIGPFVLGLVTPGDLHRMAFFEELALGIIALTAGGELSVRALAERWRVVAGITAAHAIGLLLAGSMVMWLLVTRLSLLGHVSAGEAIAAAALLGVLAVAKSPATTIAIITETRARGELVDTVLGVTILKDLVILVIFTVVNGFARTWVGGSGVDLDAMAHLGGEIGLSLAAGIVLGVVLGLYLSHIALHPEVTVLAIVLVSMELARTTTLEHLLICMAAGFVVRNLFPGAGVGFLHALERSSPPIYVVFFALVGAGLDLGVFSTGWVAVLILFAARLALVFGFTAAPAAGLRATPAVRRYAWMGFVAQAGFSLGLAARIAHEYPTFGGRLATLVVGVIVINQLIGPVLWRHALVASGEAGFETSGEREPG